MTSKEKGNSPVIDDTGGNDGKKGGSHGSGHSDYKKSDNKSGNRSGNPSSHQRGHKSGHQSGSKKDRYEALVGEYYNDIFRYAYWLSKSRQVAEDLVQETFLRAWRALDSLENPGAAKAWLFTILRRENARLYEKYRPETDDLDDFEVPGNDKLEPDQLLDRELLYKAMADLEPEYRDPLLLQVVGGFSGEEIAQMLDLNNNTVMTRLFRARNKLKDRMDDGNDDRVDRKE